MAFGVPLAILAMGMFLVAAFFLGQQPLLPRIVIW